MDPKQFVAICTPIRPYRPYSGLVPVPWATVLGSLLRPTNVVLIPVFVADDVGLEIAECRNRIVMSAFANESPSLRCHSLFWWDDDVLPGIGVLLYLYNLMQDTDKDIVSGMYFTRMADGLSRALILPSPGGGTVPFQPNTRHEAWGWANGLSLVKADVYRKLLPTVGRDKYNQPEFYRARVELSPDPDTPGLLRAGTSDDAWFFGLVGERLGTRALVDCGKHAFGFHYDATTGKGYPEKQWGQASEGRAVTWDVPGGGVVTWE